MTIVDKILAGVFYVFCFLLGTAVGFSTYYALKFFWNLLF